MNPEHVPDVFASECGIWHIYSFALFAQRHAGMHMNFHLIPAS